MNTLVKGTLISGVVVLGASAFAVPAFAQSGNGYMRGKASAQSNLASSPATTSLSTDEQQTLVYMIEEEKLAHDIYAKLYEKWGLNIFNNISNSETKHQSLLTTAASHYLVANPASSEAGVFNNQDLQKLYNDLLAKGLSSKQAALEVGKTIEEHDIADLQQAINQSSSSYLDSVYATLLHGSQNHLNAFNRQLNR